MYDKICAWPRFITCRREGIGKRGLSVSFGPDRCLIHLGGSAEWERDSIWAMSSSSKCSNCSTTGDSSFGELVREVWSLSSISEFFPSMFAAIAYLEEKCISIAHCLIINLLHNLSNLKGICYLELLQVKWSITNCYHHIYTTGGSFLCGYINS